MRKPRPNPTSPRPIWIAGIATLLVAGGILFLPAGRGHHHPEPHLDDPTLGHAVLPATFFGGNPRAALVYSEAREIGVLLDGIYCYCACQESLGHRSLLQCFESLHGAGCDVCMTEVEIAYRMTQDGRSLPEIRLAIDQAMQSS